MQCQEKVLHCFPSIVEKIPIILLKQEEQWYNKTIEMARRLDLMSLRYAMALFFETTLFWCLCLSERGKKPKNADKPGLNILDYKFQYVSVGPRQQTQKRREGHETERFYRAHWFVEMHFIGYSTAMNPTVLASMFSKVTMIGIDPPLTTRKQHFILMIIAESLVRNCHQAHPISF